MVRHAMGYWPQVGLAYSFIQINQGGQKTYIMSMDHKYEAYLCDLLSLMQEGLLRLFQQKAMDRNKFKHYFISFYQKMAILQDSFHQTRLKATQVLRKLRDYCTINQPQITIYTSRSNNKNSSDKPIQPPLVKVKSNHKVTSHSRELKSIQQEEQDPTNKRRSETAGAFRARRNPNVNNSRPMTGFIKNRDRYQDNTISYQKTPNINTSSSHSYGKLQSIQYQKTVDVQISHGRRKSFYDDLQKQARQDPLPTKNSAINYRKKLSRSQHKWTQKISRLL